MAPPRLLEYLKDVRDACLEASLMIATHSGELGGAVVADCMDLSFGTLQPNFRYGVRSSDCISPK